MHDIKLINSSGNTKCFIYKDGLDGAIKKLVELVMKNEEDISDKNKAIIYSKTNEIISSGKFMPSFKLITSILKNADFLTDQVLEFDQYVEREVSNKNKDGVRIWLTDPALTEKLKDGDFAHIVITEKEHLLFIEELYPKKVRLSLGIKAELIDEDEVVRKIFDLVKKSIVKEVFFIDKQIAQKIDNGMVKKMGQFTNRNEQLFFGYINLTSFLGEDNSFFWDNLKETVKIMVRFLDNVIDIYPYKNENLKKHNIENRSVYICPTSFNDVVKKMASSQKEAEVLVGKLAGFIVAEAEMASMELAKEKGESKILEENITRESSTIPLRNNIVLSYIEDKSLMNLQFFDDDKVIGINNLNLTAVLQNNFNGLINIYLNIEIEKGLEEFKENIINSRDFGIYSLIFNIKKKHLNSRTLEKENYKSQNKDNYPLVEIAKTVNIKVPKGMVKVTIIYSGVLPKKIAIDKQTLGCDCSIDAVSMFSAGINIAFKNGSSIKEILEEVLNGKEQIIIDNTLNKASSFFEAVIKALIIIDNHKY